MRHFLIVDVFADGIVGRGAHGLEQEQDLFLLDELPNLLHRLGRAVPVVKAEKPDLAPVDAALLVYHREIGGLRLADSAIGRGRAAVRHGLADLDFAVAGTRGIALLGSDRLHRQGKASNGDDHRR